jgi:hypothetical protein
VLRAQDSPLHRLHSVAVYIVSLWHKLRFRVSDLVRLLHCTNMSKAQMANEKILETIFKHWLTSVECSRIYIYIIYRWEASNCSEQVRLFVCWLVACLLACWLACLLGWFIYLCLCVWCAGVFFCIRTEVSPTGGRSRLFALSKSNCGTSRFEGGSAWLLLVYLAACSVF